MLRILSIKLLIGGLLCTTSSVHSLKSRFIYGYPGKVPLYDEHLQDGLQGNAIEGNSFNGANNHNNNQFNAQPKFINTNSTFSQLNNVSMPNFGNATDFSNNRVVLMALPAQTMVHTQTIHLQHPVVTLTAEKGDFLNSLSKPTIAATLSNSISTNSLGIAATQLPSSAVSSTLSDMPPFNASNSMNQQNISSPSPSTASTAATTTLSSSALPSSFATISMDAVPTVSPLNPHPNMDNYENISGKKPLSEEAAPGTLQDFKDLNSAGAANVLLADPSKMKAVPFASIESIELGHPTAAATTTNASIAASLTSSTSAAASTASSATISSTLRNAAPSPRQPAQLSSSNMGKVSSLCKITTNADGTQSIGNTDCKLYRFTLDFIVAPKTNTTASEEMLLNHISGLSIGDADRKSLEAQIHLALQRNDLQSFQTNLGGAFNTFLNNFMDENKNK